MTNSRQSRWRRENPELVRKLQQEWKRNNQPRVREYRWREQGIDISWGDYQALLIAQDGVCAICRQPPTDRALCVDHDRITKIVRGLLCRDCNLAIGYLRHETTRAYMAAEYLKNYEQSEEAISHSSR